MPRLREATPRDLDALLALERRCYPPASAYDEADYRAALADADAVNLVLEDDSGIAGFGGGLLDRAAGAGHVYTVNVDPSRRGEGLGRRLMEALEARFREARLGRAVLEVNVANAEAIRLYERGGYRRVGRLRNYYETYAEPDAFLYEKRL